MPPSQRSSCKSADENSLSGRSPKYIDFDIESDMVLGKAGESKRSHTRSDGHRPQAPGRGAATELHINLQIEVGDRRFYLHKFPLVSKSGRLNSLVFESRNAEKDRITLSDIPGGAAAFECTARHFYGGKVELSPHNVAAIRCAAEYLEIAGEGNNSLVTRSENYLNYEVTDSWRDSIVVLESCSELHPWADDLEIVRRCSESIAWKCTEARKGRGADWWFDGVCFLGIDAFSGVIRALTAKGYSSLVTSAVVYYAEKWLQLTKGSDMSTNLKLTTKSESESPQAASFMAFTGFNQDIVAKDAKQTQHKNRAILQGIVNVLPPGTSTTSLSVKFLLKLLRVACLVNAGSFCKTDLAKRIASQLEKVSLDDLLIPAAGEATYDLDAVQQIVEFYVRDQSWGNSPPQSPRSSVSGVSTTSRSRSRSRSRSLTSSVSSSDLSDSSVTSGSSVTTASRRGRSNSGSDSESLSRSGRSVSTNSGSNSGSSSSSSFRSSSDTGSSISGSSSNLSSSFRSTSSESSSTSLDASSETTSSSSASGVSSDESVKLEKKAFYLTESSPSRKTSLLPPTTANFKVAQLLETYLEEVAKDSSSDFGQFMKLAELFTEFPRDSDDSIYRAIDGFLRAHPSLTDTERKSLCRLMDPGALSLAACVHAASNERLPLRVIVQLLFSEQIKLRNEMTGNDVINEKDLGSELPSFSTSTTSSSTTESSSDATSTTLSSGSSSTSASSSTRSSSTRKSSRRSLSISSASALNELAIPARSPSAASSQLLGGLSVKETLRFVLAEIESLRKSVQEIETVKSRLTVLETLQLEMEHLATKFQEMSQDYVGMTQQVEELTKGSKQTKSGWSSGWKKVTKSFQAKDNQDHKNETPPLPPVRLHPTDVPDLPVLKTSKSDTLHPKTPRADASAKTTARADSLPITKTKTDSVTLHPKTPRADCLPQLPVTKTPKAVPDLAGNPKRGEAAKPGTSVQTPRDSFKTMGQEIVVKSEASTPSTSKRGDAKLGTPVQTSRDSFKATGQEIVVKSEASTPSISKRGEAKLGTPVQTPRDSFKGTGQEIVVKSEATTPAHSGPLKGKEGYAITAHRSHHVEDVHRRSVRSRSTSPDYVRSRHYKDSDSVTSTSSYTTTSSGRGGHQYRRKGRNGGSQDKHHSHGHRAEKSLGHGRSEEYHGPSHRKHRQKEGSHNGQSHDSHPARHSSATQAQSQHSGHHRYKEGSVASHHSGSEHHSGSHRSGHRHKDRHKEHHSHRRRQSFSDDSGASGDFVAPRRRQHRT